MFDDLRAGVACGAAVENTGRWQSAHRIGRWEPGLRAFACRFVEFRHAVRHGETEIHCDTLAGNDWPDAVIDLPTRLVLIEAEMQELPQIISRLRYAARNRPGDSVRQGIGGAIV